MNNWIPARDAWRSFCQRNPGFGLNGGEGSYVWFVRTYSPQLPDVLKKTATRRWLADAENFDAAAFSLLTKEVDKS